MSHVASLIADMVREGVSPELIGRTAQALADLAATPKVDETAERRRAADRERKARLPRDWSALRLDVFERDGWACTYCGTPGDAKSLHCDHVIPSSKGGSNDPENLTTACSLCNVRKKDRLDWVAP